MEAAPSFDILCSACQSIFENNALDNVLITRGSWPRMQYFNTLRSTSGLNHTCHLCSMILLDLELQPGSYDLLHLFYTLELLSEHNNGDALENHRQLSLKITAKYGNLPSLYVGLIITTLSPREKVNILARRSLISSALSTNTLSQLKTWLQICQLNHPDCSNSWKLVSADRRLPTRLLHTFLTTDGLKICLTNTTLLPKDLPYLTLSHRWGSNPLIQLTSNSYSAFTESIPFESLPKTFQDAIHLTQVLGYQYLWIDSLCIIQDSHEDWIYESSVMGEVYAHGHLNIAATASEDSRGGLFNQTTSTLTSPCLVGTKGSDDLSDKSSGGYMIYPDQPWLKNVENTPLGKRGWVVQERVLAPRIVHFASDQIYWDCCQDKAAELLPAESISDDGELKKVAPYPGTSEAGDNRWVYQNWNKILEKYTKCYLTYSSDKLAAFSGLARRVCNQLNTHPTDYLAGLWTPNIIHDLLWRVDRCGESGRRISPYTAPTWSWASINGPILTLDDRAEQEISSLVRVKILGIETDHNGDPFGQLTGGRLIIQGPLILLGGNGHVLLTKDRKSSDGTWAEHWTKIKANWIDDYHQSAEATTTNDTYMLLVKTYHLKDFDADICGLILRPTRRGRGQYRRLGVMLHNKAHNLDQILRLGRDKSMLDEILYQEHDEENGFTIVII